MSDLPDSLRMSSLRMFLQCPKRFELAVLGGERGEAKSERLRVGTALDRVVRHWAEQKRDGGVVVSDPDDELNYRYEQAADEDEYAPPTTDETHIIEAARRILPTIGAIIAKVNPVLVDAKLSRALTTASGTVLGVTGTLDLTYRHTVSFSDRWRGSGVSLGPLKSHHLRDVKMSGKPAGAWSAEAAAQDFQLRTYTWLADLDDATRIDTQGWIVGRALKRDTQVIHEAADVTDAAVVQQGERLVMIASAVEDACVSGRFLPTAAIEGHWSCQANYCALWERVCDHGKRAKAQVAIGEAA